MVGPSEVMPIFTKEEEVGAGSTEMAERIFIMPSEVPAISMEVQEVEAPVEFPARWGRRAASEAVGRLAITAVMEAEEEGEAGVVVVADRVTMLAAPAEVADPFSPRSHRMG